MQDEDRRSPRATVGFVQGWSTHLHGRWPLRTNGRFIAVQPHDFAQQNTRSLLRCSHPTYTRSITSAMPCPTPMHIVHSA